MNFRQTIRICFASLLIGLLGDLKAQNLTISRLGFSRPGLNWQSIDNGKVEIIFPRGFEKRAERIARITSSLSDNLTTLGERRRKVSIVMRNLTNQTNGVVAYSPFRSEFYTTPPQVGLSGTTSWLDVLAIHEYRHVQQFNNIDQGASKMWNFLYGQRGKAIQLSEFPLWFFEGDATLNETLLTNGGRGRLSNFINQYRALALENKHNFSYERASAIYSFKSFLPSHYHLGYYMTAHIRKTYGEAIWEKIIKAVSHTPVTFYAFGRMLKQETGKTTHQLYNETFQGLKTYWQTHQKTLKLTHSTRLNDATGPSFKNYKLPQYLNQDSWIVEKSSFNQIPTFYVIDRAGKEQYLFQVGKAGTFNKTLHYRGDWMVWTELRPHPRWYETDYYVIKAYNFKTRRKRTLSRRSRYFAPNLSHNSERIVVVRMDAAGNSTLEILNLEGEVLNSLTNPDDYFYALPTWAVGDKALIVVAQKNSLNALVKINLATGKHEVLVDWTAEQITFPRVKGRYIFFSATDGGINNIHAFDTETRRRYQITSTLLGAYEPDIAPDGKELIFTEYTSKGRNLQIMPLDSTKWTPFTPQENFSNTWLADLPQSEVQPEPSQLVAKPYKPERHFLNLHSWSLIPTPLMSSNSNNSLYSGLFLDDKLSNFSAELGVALNLEESALGLGASVKYGGWTPILELGLQTVERKLDMPVVISSIQIGIIRNKWREQDLFFKVSLPINLSTGNTNRTIGLIGSYHNVSLTYKELEPLKKIIGQDETISYLELGMTFKNQKTTSLRQVYPSFGQNLALSYQQTGSDTQNKGERLKATGTFYLPGLMRTHNFFIDVGYVQQQYSDRYQFGRNFFQTRGYTSLPVHDGRTTFRFNYTFPLFYPDLAVRGVAFWRRAFLNVFYDYTQFSESQFALKDILNPDGVEVANLVFKQTGQEIRSIGVEVFFDIRLFRLFTLSSGVRYSSPLDLKAKPRTEFVLRGLGL